MPLLHYHVSALYARKESRCDPTALHVVVSQKQRKRAEQVRGFPPFGAHLSSQLPTLPYCSWPLRHVQSRIYGQGMSATVQLDMPFAASLKQGTAMSHRIAAPSSLISPSHCGGRTPRVWVLTGLPEASVQASCQRVTWHIAMGNQSDSSPVVQFGPF